MKIFSILFLLTIVLFNIVIIKLVKHIEELEERIEKRDIEYLKEMNKLRNGEKENE